MMLQVFGLFFLLIAVSLGLMSGVCIVGFRRRDAENWSVAGFLKRPGDYVRQPFGGMSWGFGVLALICALIGAAMLLVSMVYPG